MNNIDLITDKLCRDRNLIYDELDGRTKLSIYAQAMRLDSEGVNVELQFKPPPQNCAEAERIMQLDNK